MTFLDLFAGVGGFRRGMELAGHKCLGFCEWDKYARMSYISMHCITDEQRAYLATLDYKQRQKEILKSEYLNGEWCSDDIRSVDAGNIPKADCWCFGAPCQDFSVAGNRAGLNGDRSSLVREVFRILGEIREENRPEWLIYENVKGMLSSNRGFDFLSILLELDVGGYDIEWQLLNSKLHGVPQNRERVYTIGHLRARGCRKVFPISAASGKDCIQGISLIGTRKGYHRNLQTFSPYGVTETLSTCEGGGREHHVALPLFGIDFNVGGQERPIANTIKARYDAGVTNFKQDGTAVAVPVTFANGQVLGKIDVAHCLSAYGPAKEGVNTHQAMNRVCVPIKDAVAKGYSDAYVGDSINLTAINSKTRRGRVGGGGGTDFGHTMRSGNIGSDRGPCP